MKALLVDTDVVSMIFKHDSRTRLYEPHLTGKQLGISFMTRAELYFWERRSNWGPAKIASLARFLQDYIVLPCDDDLWRAWADVRRTCQGKGRELTHSDAWIAATAMLYSLPLVTHNYRHFAAVDGIEVISESG